MEHDFRIRRLFPALHDPHLLAATCNAGMVCYMRYDPVHRRLPLSLDDDDAHRPAAAAAAAPRMCFTTTPSTSAAWQSRDKEERVCDEVGRVHAASGKRAASASDGADEGSHTSRVRHKTESQTPRHPPRIYTPFPVITLAWSPYASTSAGVLLTACRSQPIQLWHAESGALVSSYAAYNRSGTHVSPYTAIWLSRGHRASTRTMTRHVPDYIAGGYGGFEDQGAQLRLFDVTRHDPLCGAETQDTSTTVPVVEMDKSRTSDARAESALWCYRSPTSHGAVGVLGEAGVHSLLLCGYRASHGAIDVVDYRHRSPVAVLRGLDSEVCAIHTHPLHHEEGMDSYYVYACGRRAASGVMCWDLRRATVPLCCLDRGMSARVYQRSTQWCDFVTVSRANSRHELISTSLAGGLVIHDITHGGGEMERACVVDSSTRCMGVAENREEESGVRNSTPRHTGQQSVHACVGGRVVHADVGPTSALALLPDGSLATVVGERTFTLRRMPTRAGDHMSSSSKSHSPTVVVSDTPAKTTPRDDRAKRSRVEGEACAVRHAEGGEGMACSHGNEDTEDDSDEARHAAKRESVAGEREGEEEDACGEDDVCMWRSRTTRARVRAAMSDSEEEAEEDALFAAPRRQRYSEATPNVVVLIA